MKKVILLLTFLFSFSTYAIDDAKIEALFQKCKSLSPELKQKYRNTCLKVLSLKKEKLQQEKQNLNNEKQSNEKKPLEPSSDDPLFKNIDNASSGLNIYINYNTSMGSVKGFDLDLERQLVYFSYGIFYSNQDLISLDKEVQLKGSSYGLSARYHFYPLNYTKTKKIFNPDLYLKLGQSSFTSNLQGKLPTYIYGETGFEASYPMMQNKNLNMDGFARIGISTIYHSETNLLNLGNSIGIGIKFGF